MTDRKKVKLTAEGVYASDRSVFNDAVGFSDETRGEIISKLMREYAESVLGKEGVEARIRRFEDGEAKKPHQESTNSILEENQSPPEVL